MPSLEYRQESKSASPLSSPVQYSPIASPSMSSKAAEHLSQSSISMINAQMFPSVSDLSSIELLDHNSRNQCVKMLNQAQQQVQMQNIPAALNSIENILQIAPDFIDALTLKAQLLGTIGYFQDALAAANQVVQIDPGNALGWSICATLMANTGQLHE